MLKRKQLVVNTIRRAAGTIGPDGKRMLGNILINGMWFSSRELRNCLIGASLSPQIPVLALKGAKLSYDELTITPEDVEANPEGVIVNIQGRPVTFKKAGENHINMDIDFSSLNITENILNLAKLSQIVGVDTPVRPTVTKTVEKVEEVEETVEEEEGEVEETVAQAEQIADES